MGMEWEKEVVVAAAMVMVATYLPHLYRHLVQDILPLLLLYLLLYLLLSLLFGLRFVSLPPLLLPLLSSYHVYHLIASLSHLFLYLLLQVQHCPHEQP